MFNDSLTCTVLRGDMSFCGRQSVPLAPFPICRVHLMKAHGFVQDFMQAASDKAADERHLQFRHLRLGRWEKFRPAQDLQDHIGALIERHGPPSITSDRVLRDK